jgi:hypothetical protein
MPGESHKETICTPHDAIGFVEDDWPPEDPADQTDGHGNVSAFREDDMRTEKEEDACCFQTCEWEEQGKEKNLWRYLPLWSMKREEAHFGTSKIPAIFFCTGTDEET